MKKLAWAYALLLSGCGSTLDSGRSTYFIDGIKATAVQSGESAVVTLDAKNPSDWEGQQAMVQRAVEAAGVLTGCYAAPKPNRDLDAYIAGAEPVRIAVDLQC